MQSFLYFVLFFFSLVCCAYIISTFIFILPFLILFFFHWYCVVHNNEYRFISFMYTVASHVKHHHQKIANQTHTAIHLFSVKFMKKTIDECESTEKTRQCWLMKRALSLSVHNVCMCMYKKKLPSSSSCVFVTHIHILR